MRLPQLEQFQGIRSHAVAGVHEIVVKAVHGRLRPGMRVFDLARGPDALVLRLQRAGNHFTACGLIVDKLQLKRGVTFVRADLNSDFASKF